MSDSCSHYRPVAVGGRVTNFWLWTLPFRSEALIGWNDHKSAFCRPPPEIFFGYMDSKVLRPPKNILPRSVLAIGVESVFNRVLALRDRLPVGIFSCKVQLDVHSFTLERD